jgi:DNA-binding transcriptional MerR regulator
MNMKIGQVAERTGLSVRTLHHYQDKGLLVPTGRTDAGHRLYTEGDLLRLLHIRTLKQLGLALEEIRQWLDDPATDLLAAVERRLAAVREQVDAARRMQDRLTAVAESLRSREAVAVDDVLDTLEAMTVFEKYFTEDQKNTLEERRETLGVGKIENAELEWPRLIAAVQAAMDANRDPQSHEVIELARRWKELLTAFSGGDRKIEQSAKQMYMAEPWLMKTQGLSPEMFEFISKAMK